MFFFDFYSACLSLYVYLSECVNVLFFPCAVINDNNYIGVCSSSSIGVSGLVACVAQCLECRSLIIRLSLPCARSVVDT